MEYIYIKNHTRKWCTDEIDLYEHFKLYSQRMEVFNIHHTRAPNKSSALDYLQSALKEANGLSKKELEELQSATDPLLLNEILLDPTTPAGKSSDRKEQNKRAATKKMLHSKCPKPSTSKKRSDGLIATDRPAVESSYEDTPLPVDTRISNKAPSRPTFLCRKQKGKRRKSQRHIKDNTVDLNIVNLYKPVRKHSKGEDYHSQNRLALKARLPRTDVLVMDNVSSGYKNMYANREYAVHFRIHEPFKSNGPAVWRPGRCTHEICALGSQTLSDLRDKIICETDYQDIRGDVSLTPSAPVRTICKEVYQSSMFYIRNTFYIDKRQRDLIDYSQGLKEWSEKRDINLGETLPMEKTKISDLKLRFGYPYLYVHQGNCEHLVIVSNARLVASADNRSYEDYPLLVRLTHKNVVYCMLCNRYPLMWIVTKSERLLYDTSFLCDRCFKRYNYVNGKKVENFEAYRYSQRGTII